MDAKHFNEIQKNVAVRKRLAKYMALHCFRNTAMLENLHAGKVPEPCAGDYTDVKVVSTREDIAWGEFSRFNNDEMKALMIEVVYNCNQFLAALFTTSAGNELIDVLKARDLVPKRNDEFIDVADELDALSGRPSRTDAYRKPLRGGRSGLLRQEMSRSSKWDLVTKMRQSQRVGGGPSVDGELAVSLR
jgi:hypothetical protein